MGEIGCECSQCLVELFMAGWHVAHTRAGCDHCMSLEDYIGIKLSKGLFHKHNGIKHAARFRWKGMIDWVRVINNNFGADLLWRTSKTGHCSALSYGLAIAARLTRAPYGIKPGVFLLGTPCKFNLGFLNYLWKCGSQTQFFALPPIPTII